MTFRLLTISGAWCLSLAGCQAFPSNTTVAEYCSDAENAVDPVCQLNVEINGQKTALADTDLRLSEARSVADGAQTTADEAKAMAEESLRYSEAALSDDLLCETRTVQKSNVGACEPGWKLMSCTQTRFTYAAGGVSIMREINDDMCRFHDRVLEMQLRCCTVAVENGETAEDGT